MTTDVDVVTTTAVRPVAPVALLHALRPKQWVKNLLVTAAPIAGGVITRPHVIAGALVAFLAFTLASAGGYLLNDVQDVGRDRLHPEKRKRPIASGALSVPVAVAGGGALTVLAPLLALAADHESLAAVLVVYSALSIGYGLGVKQVPGVELAVLSAGFVLRPIGGALAAQVPPSPWFLAVCCLAALTIATGKRQVELQSLGRKAREHRPALKAYSVAGLRRLRAGSLALMLAAYVGWALTRSSALDRVLALASEVPVAVAMLRLGVLNDAGDGDAPESVLLRDRVIHVAVIVWACVFVLGLGRV
jgi:decaprenyl-phosphate phosphoribosyltransferase